MKSAFWLITLAVNVALLFLALWIAFAAEVAPALQFLFVSLALLVLSIVGCMLAAKLGRLPGWGTSLTRFACISIPILWLLGSLDRGILSPQEVALAGVVAAFFWVTWRAFRLFPGSLTIQSRGN